MMRWLQLGFLAFVLVAFTGCGTLQNMADEPPGMFWPGGDTVPTRRVFGGLRYDVEITTCAVTSTWPSYGWALYGPWLGYVWMVDMPMCLVSDTLTLPWTAYAEVQRW